MTLASLEFRKRGRGKDFCRSESHALKPRRAGCPPSALVRLAVIIPPRFARASAFEALAWHGDAKGGLVRKFLGCMVALLALGVNVSAAHAQGASGGLAILTQPQDYVLRRVSSYDRTGGNADYRRMAAGETLTLLDEGGP